MKTEEEIKKMLEHENEVLQYNLGIAGGHHLALIDFNKVRIKLLEKILEIGDTV